MPGRVAGTTRSTRTSTAAPSRKASSQTLTDRKSTTSRTSQPTIDIPEESADNGLRKQICSIFSDTQRNTAGHRKLVVNLRKIQEACCYEPSSNKKSKHAEVEEFDEAQFNEEFIRCVVRCMPIKKSEAVGERVIRFIGLFLKHANEKDNELNGGDGEESEMLFETPSTRLTSQLMTTILPLMTAKEKFVRYRSTQLVSHVINSLEAIDDDLFQLLRHGLLKRIHDKEAMVRVQAVLGLGRLAGNEADGEADDSDDDSAAGLLDKLLEVLQNDPSADVRRSLLVNLPILPNTLPFLLERARDQDAATRRALYSRLLPALGDFRHLSLSMREKLLRWGLRDRDENVRKAAGKLFRERWIEDCAGTAAAEAEEGVEGAEAQPKKPSFEGLLELLERIDVVNSGVENGVALEAMKGFWEGRPDYRDEVTFDDSFWDTLSAESVFMARSFNDFCRNEGNGKFEPLIEEKMPEVTKLAYYLSQYIEVLVEALKRVATQAYSDDQEEEDTVEQEFIVEQLLHIAGTLDYSDEVGRRKMFALLRQSLSIPDLPEEVTRLTIEVLRGICASDAAGEREFCSVVLEAVADVHDTIMDEPAGDEDADESFHSARSAVSSDSTPTKSKSSKKPLNEADEQEKAIREIMVNMKCLHIVQCMLENIEGELQKNADLVAMLNNLVVPAVRSQEAPIRERGLVCMGLCSLLDNALAEENIPLFVHFFTKGHPALQITAIQILTDILSQYGAKLLDNHPEVISKVFIKGLKSGAKSPEVQASATVAISKLLLGRVISDSSPSIDDLLRTLLILYFDASTAQNQGVRQTLSYFLPVYSFSRKENQDRVRGVSVEVLRRLFEVKETFDEDAEAELETVSLSTVGAHLVDWTDPRRCYVPGSQMGLESEKKSIAGDVHLAFAQDIVNRLYTTGCNQQEKKLLCPLLSKLYISPTSTPTLLRETYSLINDAVEDRKLTLDATSRNSLYKIHVSLGKIVNALDRDSEERGTTEKVSRGGSETPTVVEEDEKTVMESGKEGKKRVNEVEESHDELDDGEEETILAVRSRESVGARGKGKEKVVVKKEVQEEEEDELVSELLSDVEMSGM